MNLALLPVYPLAYKKSNGGDVSLLTITMSFVLWKKNVENVIILLSYFFIGISRLEIAGNSMIFGSVETLLKGAELNTQGHDY